MDVQQTQKLLVEMLALSAVGTFVLSLVGRWIGGAWTTMVAITSAVVLVYKPMVGGLVFDNFTTDLIRRILIAAIPFTALVLATSWKTGPAWGRFAVAALAPTAMLYWVFMHYDLAVPRVTLLTHEVLPVAGVVLVLWAMIEPIAVRTPGPAVPIVLGFTTGGIAIFLLLLSQGSQAGEISPMLPASAAGALLAAIASSFIGKKPLSFARGPVLLWLTLTAAFFSFMWFDTNEIPLVDLLLIASVPVLAWIPETGTIHRMKPWKRESIRFVLLAIPFGMAVVLANRQSAAQEQELGLQGPTHSDQSAAPILPRYTPIAKTIIPPTIT
jgi:hypothetical protein